MLSANGVGHGRLSFEQLELYGEYSISTVEMIFPVGNSKGLTNISDMTRQGVPSYYLKGQQLSCPARNDIWFQYYIVMACFPLCCDKACQKYNSETIQLLVDIVRMDTWTRGLRNRTRLGPTLAP